MAEIKKTFILINNMGGGGAERQVSSIAMLNEIDKVILIESTMAYEVPKEKLEILTKHLSGRNVFKKLYQLAFALYKLRRLGVDKQTHLICFLQLSYIIGFLCKLLYGCKLTFSIRTNPFAYYTKNTDMKIPFSLYTFILRKTDYVVSNSEATADQMKIKLGLKNSLCIPNGYDINTISTLAEQETGVYAKIFDESLVLLSVGRLFHEKAHWHLIRVYNELVKKYPRLTLFILGDGPLKAELVNLCRQYNLKIYQAGDDGVAPDSTCNVYFMGFQNNPYAFMKKSFIFLLPSLFEGLPNVLIEALICGVPCIASDCNSGPREILFPGSDTNEIALQPEKSEYGYLMPPFSGEKIFDTRELTTKELFWVQAIDELILSPEVYHNMKTNTISLRSTFKIEKAKEKWLRFLNNVH